MFTIGVHEAPPFIENSHLTIEPVCPLNVSVPLFVPEQTEALLVTVPPTETGVTVIVALPEIALAQAPF